MNRGIAAPKKRSDLRLKLGHYYYGTKRKLMWVKMNKYFAKERKFEPLLYSCFAHKTVLLRKLKDVDMWLQENKVINLKLASKRVHGIIIRPGEIFSYWKLIGNTTR